MATNVLSFPVAEELLALPQFKQRGTMSRIGQATTRNRDRIPVSDKAAAVALLIVNQIGRTL